MCKVYVQYLTLIRICQFGLYVKTMHNFIFFLDLHVPQHTSTCTANEGVTLLDGENGEKVGSVWWI